MKLKKKEQKQIPESIELEQDEEKVKGVKTDTLMKVGRIILWLVILFLLFKGVVSVLTPNSEIKVEQMITDYRADSELREKMQVQAAAFAEDFAYEYYTFSGKYNSDYEQRVKRYTAKNLDIKSPTGSQHSTKVILSSAEHITYQNNKDLDVDIHLQVEYLPLEEGAQREQKDIYIRVPITLGSDENFAVTSLPSFIPQTNAASKVTAVDTYKGIQVDNAEVQKIKETLNSFLTVYFGGTANEISYYLTNDSEISKVASGMVEYQNLDYATVCQEDGTNEYLVDAKFTVKDNGQIKQQRVFIRMQYAKKHYYIKSINTRPI